jgi:sugar lactone lactonase YvrE
MYVVGFSNDTIYQYSLSTAYDLSTASYDSVSFSVGTQDGVPVEVIFNNDGTKMYMLGQSNDRIFQYSLSTAFNVSTASYDSVSFSVNNQEAVPGTIVFNNDGTKLYMMGNAQHKVFQYSLSTAYDLSTISYDSVSFSVIGQDEFTVSITFNNDGTKMYMLGRVNNRIFQYSLSTAFVLSTASYDNVNFSVASQDTQPRSIIFNNDGSKLYLVGTQNDSIYEYTTGYDIATTTLDLSTGSVFEVTPTFDTEIILSNPAASGTVSQGTLLLRLPRYDLINASYDSVSFSVATQDGVPLGFAFKPDGTKLFIAGNQNDTIYQYSLSTAFDISTMTYDNISKYVGSEELFLAGVRFNNDGTKMYVVGYNTDEVEEYNLSTAWNISTATYNNVNFSISDTSPREVIFNSDGSKMYVLGDGNESIYQYSLSTNFDLSTASYNDVSLSVSAQSAEPTSMAFNSDGTKLFLLSRETAVSTGAVYQYTLSTAYDLSTGSYDNITFNISGQDANAYGIGFDSDGSKMYVLGYNTDQIYQYTIGSGVESTIAYDSAIQFGGGTAPDSPAIGETDVITFSTRDGGTSYQAMQAIDGAK